MDRRQPQVIVTVFLWFSCGAALAQHEMHHPPPPAPTPAPPVAEQHAEMPEQGTQQPVSPDAMALMEEMEPMDHWMTMFHGYAFLTANRQGGPAPTT